MKQPLALKLRASGIGIRHVLSSPAYFGLLLAGAFVAIGIVLWVLNTEVLWFVITSSSVSVREKARFIFEMYASLYATISFWQSTAIVVFGVLFGCNLSMFVFTLKHQINNKQDGARLAGSSIFGLFISSCAACGTTILAPLLGLIGITSVPLIARLGTAMMLAGIALLVYSIYLLGIRAATIRVQ